MPWLSSDAPCEKHTRSAASGTAPPAQQIEKPATSSFVTVLVLPFFLKVAVTTAFTWCRPDASVLVPSVALNGFAFTTARCLPSIEKTTFLMCTSPLTFATNAWPDPTQFFGDRSVSSCEPKLFFVTLVGPEYGGSPG